MQGTNVLNIYVLLPVGTGVNYHILNARGMLIFGLGTAPNGRMDVDQSGGVNGSKISGKQGRGEGLMQVTKPLI